MALQAKTIGRVAVKVVPDTSKFRSELKALLEKEEANLRLSIPLELDADGLKADLARTVKELEAYAKREKIHIETKVDSDTLTRSLKDALDESTHIARSEGIDVSEAISRVDSKRLSEGLNEAFRRHMDSVALDIDTAQAEHEARSFLDRLERDIEHRRFELGAALDEDSVLRARDRLRDSLDQKVRLKVDLDDHDLDTIGAEFDRVERDAERALHRVWRKQNFHVGVDFGDARKDAERYLNDMRRQMRHLGAEGERAQFLVDVAARFDKDDVESDVNRYVRQIDREMQRHFATLSMRLDDKSLGKVEKRLYDLRRARADLVVGVDQDAVRSVQGALDRVKSDVRRTVDDINRDSHLEFSLPERREIRRDLNRYVRDIWRDLDAKYVELEVTFDPDRSKELQRGINKLRRNLADLGQGFDFDLEDRIARNTRRVNDAIDGLHSRFDNIEVDVELDVDVNEKRLRRGRATVRDVISDIRSEIALTRDLKIPIELKAREIRAEARALHDDLKRQMYDIHQEIEVEVDEDRLLRLNRAIGDTHRQMGDLNRQVIQFNDTSRYLPGRMQTITSHFRDLGRAARQDTFGEFWRGLRGGYADVDRTNNSFTRWGRSIDRVGNGLSNTWSRSRWIGMLPRLLGTITSAIGGVVSVGGQMIDVFKSVQRVSGTVPALFASMGTGLAGLVKGLGPAIALFVALSALLGPLAAGLISLMNAVIALAGSITIGLIGALLPLVPLLASVASGVGIMAMAFAMAGKKDLADFKRKFSEFKAQFVKDTASIRSEMTKVASSLMEGFGAFTNKMAPAITAVLKDFNAKLGERKNRDAFKAWGESLPRIFESVGKAVSSAFFGLLHFFKPILPYAERLANWIEKCAEKFESWASSAEGQNSIANFMARAWENAKKLWDVLRNVGSIVASLFDAGDKGGGKGMLDGLVKWTGDWAAALKDPKQAADLKQKFTEAKDVAVQLANALTTIAAKIGEMNTEENRRKFKDFVDNAGKLASFLIASANAASTLTDHMPTGGSGILGKDFNPFDSEFWKASGQNFVRDMGKIGGWISWPVDKLFEGLGTAINDWDWSGIWTDIWNGIKSGVTSIFPDIDWSGVKDWIVNGFKSIMGIHSPSRVMADQAHYIIDGIAQGITEWISNLGESLIAIKDAIVGFFANAGTWLLDKGQAILNGLGSAWTTASTWVGEKWGLVKTWIRDKFADAGTWLSDKGTQIRDSLATGWTALSTWAGGKWTGLKEGVRQKFADAGTWLSDKGTAIKNGLVSGWNGLSSFVSSKWHGVQSWVTTKFAGAGSWLSQKGTEIKNGLGNAWNGLSGFVGGKWQGAKTWIQNKFAGAAGWLTQKGHDVRNGLTTAWNGLSGTIGSKWQGAKSWIQAKFSGATGWLSQKGNDVKNGLLKTWDGLSRLVGNKWADVKTWVTSKFSNPLGWLKQAGIDTVQGFINGMGSMMKSVWDMGSSIASKAAAALKKKLGIESPSRLMMTYGGFTTEGFIIGMRALRNRAAWTARDLAANVGKMMVTSLASSARSRMGAVTSVMGDLNEQLNAVGFDDRSARMAVTASTAANFALGEVEDGSARRNSQRIEGRLELVNGSAWFAGSLKDNARNVFKASEEGRRRERR